MTTKDYYRAVLLGVVIGMSFLSLFYVLGVAVDVKEPQEPKSDFKVVANYEGCDIIRWTNHNLAEYQYFMRCKDVQ